MTSEGGAIQSGMDWLSASQLSNGAFASQVSDTSQPFNADRIHYHTFFTSIILVCLRHVEGSEAVTRRGLKFLKSQQSQSGSWNYWDRHSPMARDYTFPDDLDDTAYALLALSMYDPKYVDGEVMAGLAKLLIASEIKAGGPYRTWLVSRELYKQWGDVDLAVNANIGGLLNYHGLKMPALKQYVKDELKAVPSSLYYQNEIPIIYFLSRWYREPDLKRRLMAQIRQPNKKSGADLAMLLTAGCRLEVGDEHLGSLKNALISELDGDRWPASTFYVELTSRGRACYTGSPELSTALALEALTAYSRLQQPQPNKSKSNQPTAAYGSIKDASKAVTAALRKNYLTTGKLISDNDIGGQITDMSGLTAAAYGKSIDPATRLLLNQASLNGWIAYKLYDDFYDQEAKPEILAVANYAHRQTIESYYQALPNNSNFKKSVIDTLDKMDAANYWEVRNARGTFRGGKLHYKLPDYGNYSKLAERSWGHTLSAVGTLLALGYKRTDDEIISLHKFFKHYLIAKQVNDDAHDWLDDLRRGHLSSVVAMLLNAYESQASLDIENDKKTLQLHFWQTTIYEAAGIINRHIKISSAALDQCGMVDTEIFREWLDKLALATDKALVGSRQTKLFINSFQKSKIK